MFICGLLLFTMEIGRNLFRAASVQEGNIGYSGRNNAGDQGCENADRIDIYGDRDGRGDHVFNAKHIGKESVKEE